MNTAISPTCGNQAAKTPLRLGSISLVDICLLSEFQLRLLVARYSPIMSKKQYGSSPLNTLIYVVQVEQTLERP